MTDRDYLNALRIPTKEEPLRILLSACLAGVRCGVNGDSNGEYPSVLKMLGNKHLKFFTFCPEDFSFGTPREMCDIHDGDGFAVLDGKAKVLSESGLDWTVGMVRASEKMLEMARKYNIELAIMMDISAACGSQVIYDGNRYAENKKYQVGMGVCAAQLFRAGFSVISQRDYASLEILYAKVNPDHVVDASAVDHHETAWYKGYFSGRK